MSSWSGEGPFSEAALSCAPVEGLVFESSDPAGSTNEQKPTKRWDNNVSTKEETEPHSKEQEKLARSFISQCAQAHMTGKLDASHPEPPKQLKARIKSHGGNVAWLGAERHYQSIFHKAYCRFLGREIPIDSCGRDLSELGKNGPPESGCLK